MNIGRVKWYNLKTGYGFITPDECTDGKDIFLHANNLKECGLKKVLDGQRVSYETYDDNGKPAAKDITILEEE